VRSGLPRRLPAIVGLVGITALILPGLAAASSTSPPSTAVTKTETITRDHLVNGADDVVDKRTVSVTVGQTAGLRDRQVIDVSWTGAHPTGGIAGDPTSEAGSLQEYPVVVMQCRGTVATVSPETCWTQTPDERAQSSSSNWPPYRVDRYGTAADRAEEVGVPNPLPASCSFVGGVQHWVPFVAADGTVYGGGIEGCAGLPPEANFVEATISPGNTTYGVAGTNGAGSTKFIVENNETNASLGCSDTVQCSLVVIPIMGISCDASVVTAPDDPAAAFAECSQAGAYSPGELASSGGSPDLAVAGQLWWSASNWMNRITVPLQFAQPANVCNQNNEAPLYVYGSPVMTQATQQWAPYFCLNPKLVKFQHVETSEPEAKNLLAEGGLDGIEAAFVGNPPPTAYPRPVVSAPVAVSGFAVVYAIDDANGHEYKTLRLNARLLAKLLTESYPSNGSVKNDYAALSANPANLAADPEFQRLNPGIGRAIYSEAASTILVLSSDSDIIWALTSYINSDPTARAWLNGTRDPWGMKVNPNYKDIALPVTRWPLLDTFQSGYEYTATANPCLNASPSPWLPLVASPVQSIETLTLDMQFDIANSQINCVVSGNSAKLASVGRESYGQRFLLGVTTLGDASRYALDTAALQTDTAGKTFVGPTPAAMAAAAHMFKADPSQGTWTVPYDAMHTTAQGAAAYPGTMLISMDVPTTGLPRSDAAHYATFMEFAATTGQTPGFGDGQLPPGFLPMTAANGLGAEQKYTEVASTYVAAQSDTVPSISAPEPVSDNSATPGNSGNTGGGSTPTSTPLGNKVGAIPSSATANPGSSSSLPQGATQSIASVGKTLGITSGFAALALPLVLILGLLCLLAIPVTMFLARRAGARG
jgi:hypothetical protein